MTGTVEPPAVPDRVVAALAGLASPVCAYVYDTAVAATRVAALRAALPAGTAVLYAMKANGHPGVVRAFAESADGIEVASGGELRAALAAGARWIAFGGPAKTDAELAAALAAATAGIPVTINCESVHEIRRLAALAGTATGGTVPAALRVAIRVNRATTAASPTGSHAMTGRPTPFGVDEAALPDAVTAARDLPLAGFALHAVSNNLDATRHAAFLSDCVDWSVAAADRFGIRLTQVNAGGGLGIDYTGGETFDLAALRAGAPRLPAGVRLVVEPGRFLAAPMGWYAAEVIDVKRTHGRWFAVIRGGTHHFRLPAAWGYSHPFTVIPVDEWRYPVARPEVAGASVDVVGELCTPRDVLARDQPVSRLRAGDVVVFANTGGYAWDISHHEFLRHDHPAMILL